MTELSPVNDPVAGPFFEAAKVGRLIVQRCDTCAALRWPPLPGCPECRGRATTWAEVAPCGTVWSFVVYHRAFAPELSAQIPYTVAMIQLDAGPYMIGQLTDDGSPPVVGARVLAEFVDVGGVPSVHWKIVQEQPALSGRIGE
jgi:uncharacterized OB-fold protein